MGLSIQPVTFTPVTPVRPVVRSQAELTQQAPSPAPTQSSTAGAPASAGRLLDIKV